MLNDFWGVIMILFFICVLLSVIIICKVFKPKFNVKSVGQKQENNAFDGIPLVSDELKQWLEKHYESLIPLLTIWQRRAWRYGAMHYFVVIWTAIISLSLPFIIPYIGDGNYSKILVQVATAFSAIMFGLHSTFKMKELYQKYRLFESSVYTLVRKMKNDPESFGDEDSKRRINYANAIEKIREGARSVEIDNVPNPISSKNTGDDSGNA